MKTQTSDAPLACSVHLNFDYALVRGVSDSFENSLKLNPPPTPIEFTLARKQHERYIHLVKSLIPHVIELTPSDIHPDCNFIEDTAIIVGDTAVISIMGAVERRGEEIAVAHTLSELGVKNIVSLKSPATMDGGDILFTGKHLFVGLSRRTHAEALEQLQSLFSGRLLVFGIPVTESLHLKSLISLFDSDTLVVADTSAGRNIRNEIIRLTSNAYEFVLVPDAVPSNVLRIGSTLIAQQGFPETESILQDLCDRKSLNLKTLDMSELIKADGALTCGSLLFNLGRITFPYTEDLACSGLFAAHGSGLHSRDL